MAAAREKSSRPANAPCGVAVATSTLRSCCPLPPSPAAPAQATPATLSCPVLNPPALSRLRGGTRTASTLDVGLCAGSAASRPPWCRASGFASREARLFRFFGHPPSSIPAPARPASRRFAASGSAFRRYGVAGGHITLSAIAGASLRDGGTPPTGGSSARAREKRKRGPCAARTFVDYGPPTTHRTPAVIPSVSYSCTHRTHSASCPRLAARCRHVSHAARIATPFGCCKPAVLSAVSACRRFSDRRPRPPPLTRPRPPFNRLAALRKSGSEAVPEDRPRCRLCSGPGIRFAGYPAHHSSQHSAEETRSAPSHPRNGLPSQSRRRDLSPADRRAK